MKVSFHDKFAFSGLSFIYFHNLDEPETNKHDHNSSQYSIPHQIITSHGKFKNEMLLKRINECRSSIANKVIEINSIRERNRIKDGVSMSNAYKQVAGLLNDLESSLDIADNEFAEKYLDQCEKVLTKIDFENYQNCEGFANETFKALMNLLK